MQFLKKLGKYALHTSIAYAEVLQRFIFNPLLDIAKFAIYLVL